MAAMPTPVRQSAVFSRCGSYRYLLELYWGDGPLAGFVCHNPSLATDVTGDHTVSRLRGIASRWGYGGMLLANRFAGGRSPRVGDLADMADPIGPRNWRHLRDLAERADRIVVAWGDLPSPPDHTARVVDALRASGKELYCLGTTKAGAPKHPSARGKTAIPAGFKPVVWRPCAPRNQT